MAVSNADDEPEAPETTGEVFRRELRSLLLVYLALAVLPLLTGFACQG